MATTTRKVLSSVGVPALCGHVRSVGLVANAAASGVIQLSNALNQSITEIEAALNDLPNAASITILTTDWSKDTTITHSYQYYYDIIDATVSSDDLPIVSVAPDSLEVASNCELCPTCESMTGKIRMYSKSAPQGSITVNCWVITGAADEEDGGGE